MEPGRCRTNWRMDSEKRTRGASNHVQLAWGALTVQSDYGYGDGLDLSMQKLTVGQSVQSPSNGREWEFENGEEQQEIKSRLLLRERTFYIFLLVCVFLRKSNRINQFYVSSSRTLIKMHYSQQDSRDRNFVRQVFMDFYDTSNFPVH